MKCQVEYKLPYIAPYLFQERGWEGITCQDGTLIEELVLYDLCPDMAKIFTITIIVCASITIIILTVLYYKNKTKILIYCYSSQWRILRWFVSHPDDMDINKTYDAFISFANEDIHFVAETLVPGLEENGPKKYNICLHYRDWVPGELILTQINRSIKKSCRTIIVMSPDFLQSIWGQAEFKMAYTDEIRERRTRVIVIMYEDIEDEEDLDEDLRDYLNTTTYLKWENCPAFWKKLYFALPHPPGENERISCNICCLRHSSLESLTRETDLQGTLELQGHLRPSEEYFTFENGAR